MQRVLVTGAGGFIGTVLTANLSAAGYQVRAAVRCVPEVTVPDVEYFACGDINADTDWSAGVEDVTAIVHLADRIDATYTPAATGADQSAQAIKPTVLPLARAAAEASVKQLVYVSSIKVNGEDSGTEPYSAETRPRPENVYGQGKYNAEQSLLNMDTEMSVVIIRPPLVYGPGAKGNFAMLKQLAVSGIPLPFASINNMRSLVSVFNLCDFIEVCIRHQNITNEVFLVSDGHDLSTPDLVRLLASAAGKKSRLFHFPEWLLSLFAGLIGKKEIICRLCGNLQVDISKNKHLLGWVPPFTVEESLRMSIDDDHHE